MFSSNQGSRQNPKITLNILNPKHLQPKPPENDIESQTVDLKPNTLTPESQNHPEPHSPVTPRR